MPDVPFLVSTLREKENNEFIEIFQGRYYYYYYYCP